jgi:uncharacterized membrane protein YsdA (DUF1294 family)/cold shock CspA family protein
MKMPAPATTPARDPARVVASAPSFRADAMRLTGTLTDWKDDKGFGFVTPVGVGAKVFVHVSAFPAGTRRPRVGDRLLYDVDPTPAKGPRALRVQFADAAAVVLPARRLRVATVAAAAYTAAVAIAVAIHRLPSWVLTVTAFAATATFIVYALDKRAAMQGRRRVPEDTLHMLAVLGGWPGAAMAQQWLRHKSVKPAFQWMFWTTVAMNVAATAWLAFA